MPLGAKEPNRNYTVYGKFKSPSSLLYWSRKQRLYLAINKIAGLFFTYSAHPLTIKKYGGFDITNMFKICQLFLFTLSLVILFSVTIVIAQEGLLYGKVFVGQSKEKHKRAVKEDELRFMNGEFQSIGYGQRGFNEGVYAARAEEDKGSTINNFTFLHPVFTSSSSDLKPQKHQNSLLFHQLLRFEIKQI